MLKRRFRKFVRDRIFSVLEWWVIRDSIIESGYRGRVESARNPLNRFGRKSFSQADEDGITVEICRRLGLANGSYCEFGVGDGLECNTLVLAAQNWKGFWVSGQELGFSLDHVDSGRFCYVQSWVTSKNVFELFQEGCKRLDLRSVDVLSFDLDGNDLFFLQLLLESKVKPKLLIVEYNAKFIPPVRWSMPHNDDHQWDHSDYFGASLQSFADLLGEYGYRLVCCNAHTGVNAFFVLGEMMMNFAEVPSDINDIYMSPNFKHVMKFGHAKSPKTIEDILSSSRNSI